MDDLSVRYTVLPKDSGISSGYVGDDIPVIKRQPLKGFCTNKNCRFNKAKLNNTIYYLPEVGKVMEAPVKTSSITCPVCDWPIFWSRTYQVLNEQRD